LGNINLSSGKHTIKATISTAGYNLNYFQFVDPLTTTDDVLIEDELNFATIFHDQTSFSVHTENNVPLNIKATDSKGMEVYSSNAHTTNEEIAFGRDLAPGFYVLRLVYQNKVETVKVVKQ
jgi:hypothetical protein